MLSKDQVLISWAPLRYSIILPYSYVIDSLLKLLIVLLLESVQVKYEEVAIIASNPAHLSMDSHAEQSMPRSLLHNHCSKFLVIHMQLVTFASGEDQLSVVAIAWGYVWTCPVQDSFCMLDFQLSSQSFIELWAGQFANWLRLSSCHRLRILAKHEESFLLDSALTPHVWQLIVSLGRCTVIVLLVQFGVHLVRQRVTFIHLEIIAILHILVGL